MDLPSTWTVLAGNRVGYRQKQNELLEDSTAKLYVVGGFVGTVVYCVSPTAWHKLFENFELN